MYPQKTVVVTGATSGIGLATAIELAKKRYRVCLLSRDKERGYEALRKVQEESGNKALEMWIVDLGDLQSIREFAARFTATHKTIDVLINNAGVISLKRQETKDGFEWQMGVNHLGHFLLTNLLLDLLLKSEQGRIINVSSGGYSWGNFYEQDPHLKKGYTVFKGYGQSKLANILFTKELAKRLKDTAVTVNTLHPGAVATSLGVNRQTGFGKGVYKLLTPFFKTPNEGAATSIYLATSPEVKDSSGEYFINCKVAKLSKRAKDERLAEKLWEWSKAQVGE
ncbi:SDR family oxidoreductase [Evansella cellulosilytica]|uniref:Short-chain dehydrogenase/reductase SDR n=1 Tax=Evansella cellulosilytica (strain ATCC 21833 / DSM 2522 / FERM P-1141 / JCM 9156 / N-4) TaxID=649639 RepID=E6TUX5_EVAC2|nr:SDR family oxidoreductase [Evansella cellulosilytica]ADU32127.1 short-chain dehydrogenase/reductase SDR [Evansella cellulosilytica DSM 2522]